MKNYSSINREVSEAAVEKFENHLWYLGAELAVLSLFSNKITDSLKLKMIKKLQTTEDKDCEWVIRATSLTNCTNLERKTLADLIGVQSMHALKALNLKIDFMFQLHPKSWHNSKECHEAKEIVDQIKVVNDAAERAVALMTEYNNRLTKGENEKQLTIQVVEDNRKRIKSFQKKILSSYKMLQFP